MFLSFFFLPLSFLIWRLNIDCRHREDSVLLVFPTGGGKVCLKLMVECSLIESGGLKSSGTATEKYWEQTHSFPALRRWALKQDVCPWLPLLHCVHHFKQCSKQGVVVASGRLAVGAGWFPAGRFKLLFTVQNLTKLQLSNTELFRHILVCYLGNIWSCDWRRGQDPENCWHWTGRSLSQSSMPYLPCEWIIEISCAWSLEDHSKTTAYPKCSSINNYAPNMMKAAICLLKRMNDGYNLICTYNPSANYSIQCVGFHLQLSFMGYSLLIWGAILSPPPLAHSFGLSSMHHLWSSAVWWGLRSRASLLQCYHLEQHTLGGLKSPSTAVL